MKIIRLIKDRFLLWSIRRIRIKTQRLSQQMRLKTYKNFPPIQGDVGIGYKDFGYYDYIHKEYV